MPLKNRIYLGRDPTNSARLFTFNASPLALHPGQQVIAACRLCEAHLPHPYVQTLPVVESYLYDSWRGVRVVSGFVLDDDSEIRVTIPHWGGPWERWNR